MNGTPIKQFIADLTNEDLVTLCTTYTIGSM